MDRDPPTDFNPPDCNLDGTHIRTPRRQQFDQYTDEFAKQLLRDSTSGIEGLERYRRTLMEQPIVMWENKIVGTVIVEHCSIAALEIITEVIENRTECLKKELSRTWEHEGLPRGYSSTAEALEDARFRGLHHEWINRYCERIGFKYEQVKNFRAAMFWHKKALEQACLRNQITNQWKTGISDALCSLGVTHEKAGFLGDALKYYDKSMDFLPSNKACSKLRNKLRLEIPKWEGTRGQIPREEESPVDVSLNAVC
jgi:tetratricopeptide (TPR) repeat protein